MHPAVQPPVLCYRLQGIANGSLTVGDAVLFVTLMQQLYGPLNFFGTCELAAVLLSYRTHRPKAARRACCVGCFLCPVLTCTACLYRIYRPPVLQTTA